MSVTPITQAIKPQLEWELAFTKMVAAVMLPFIGTMVVAQAWMSLYAPVPVTSQSE